VSTVIDSAPAMRPPDQIDVLDQGFVRLDGALADDLSVVNAARVSFGVRKTELEPADEGLIRFLMRERHGTPFEHNTFRFHIRCPIFVVREWMRHRISSFNERSARYSELDDAFYVPAAEDVRTQVGRPGAYTFERMDDDAAERTRQRMQEVYEVAYATYRALLDDGVAKEIARAVLPVGIYTEFYWTLNARSLMNFLSLRNADAAQLEIRAYAQAVERHFAARMPVTHAAFVARDRVAP
jgi:thymidylate synthase (FAD)